jgi:hypothetical protein
MPNGELTKTEVFVNFIAKKSLKNAASAGHAGDMKRAKRFDFNAYTRLHCALPQKFNIKEVSHS